MEGREKLTLVCRKTSHSRCPITPFFFLKMPISLEVKSAKEMVPEMCPHHTVEIAPNLKQSR